MIKSRSIAEFPEIRSFVGGHENLINLTGTYIYKDSVSDKFYHLMILILNGNVKAVTCWGRNGKPPGGFKVFDNPQDAVRVMHEKMSKGYKVKSPMTKNKYVLDELDSRSIGEDPDNNKIVVPVEVITHFSGRSYYRIANADSFTAGIMAPAFNPKVGADGIPIDENRLEKNKFLAALKSI